MAGQGSSLTNPDEVVRLSYLYDFYGPLLKERHREIFEEYVLNDLSLGEIAGEYGITRQGVYDIVKRCSRKLEEYEEKLNLFGRFRQAREHLGRMEELVKDSRGKDKEQLLELARKIYEIL
ncbi:MAG: YlxM family DNA-binding protein [Roseburia sp.]|nr:YlxM family DNA-binding protein [Roseburia sp.]